MAANRAYLYCPSCGSAAYLVKTMDHHGWYCCGADVTPDVHHAAIGKDVEQFFNDHAEHGALSIQLRFERHPDPHREMLKVKDGMRVHPDPKPINGPYS